MTAVKISKNLTLKEVTKSATALKFGINNNPTEKHLQNLKIYAIKIFEQLRKGLGNHPIFSNSFYRSKKLNSMIGGAISSQHCKGQAADFDQDYKNSQITNADIFYYIKDNLDFDQLIWEFGTRKNPDWVHCSYNTNKKKQRKQILVAHKENGKIKYNNWEDMW